MGLLKGSAGWMTFRLPHNDHGGAWREIFADGIREQHHVENLFLRSKEAVFGWTDIRDPRHTQIRGEDWLLEDDLVVLGLRIDQKKVNSKMLAVQLEHKIAEIKRERGIETINKKWREEIKKILEEELLYHQTPALSMHEMAWKHEAMDDGQARIYGFAGSNAVLSCMQRLFRDTFGVLPYPDRLVDWLMTSPDWNEGSICAASTRIWGDGFQLNFHEDQEQSWRHKDLLHGHYAELCSDFLTWLWMMIDVNNGTFRIRANDELNSYDIWLESKVALLDGQQKVTLAGDHSGQSGEAMAALLQGRLPTELQLGIRNALQEEEGYTFTLKHIESIVRISGAKLMTRATPNPDDSDGTILLRMGEVEEIQHVVQLLFCRFFEERASATEPYKKRLANWIDRTTKDGPKQHRSKGHHEDPNQETLQAGIARASLSTAS